MSTSALQNESTSPLRKENILDLSDFTQTRGHKYKLYKHYSNVNAYKYFSLSVTVFVIRGMHCLILLLKHHVWILLKDCSIELTYVTLQCYHIFVLFYLYFICICVLLRVYVCKWPCGLAYVQWEIFFSLNCEFSWKAAWSACCSTLASHHV